MPKAGSGASLILFGRSCGLGNEPLSGIIILLRRTLKRLDFRPVSADQEEKEIPSLCLLMPPGRREKEGASGK